MAKTKGYHKRKGGRRPNRERKRKLIIHIICEGQNTEPDYFKEFPLTNAKVITVGKGEQHTKLVKSAISYKRKNSITKKNKEELWVVFDFDEKKDDLPRIKQDFNNAIALANKNDIKCAISNDSFELWFVLHFLFTDSENRREWYNKKLSELLGVSYSKDKSISTKMYKLLIEKQEVALRNAEKLEAFHEGKIPCDKNPYTSVYKLVKLLNLYKR